MATYRLRHFSKIEVLKWLNPGLFREFLQGGPDGGGVAVASAADGPIRDQREGSRRHSRDGDTDGMGQLLAEVEIAYVAAVLARLEPVPRATGAEAVEIGAAK